MVMLMAMGVFMGDPTKWYSIRFIFFLFHTRNPQIMKAHKQIKEGQTCLETLYSADNGSSKEKEDLASMHLTSWSVGMSFAS